VHVLVRHSGLSIPLWLNEGFAEVYSGMEIRDGKVLLGAIAEDRVRALGSSDLMHLPALFAVGTGSPEYNEQNRASVFYAESCLLTHMLILSHGYAAKFPDFLNRIAASGSAQTAFGEVYGKSIAEVERDMAAYFRESMGAGAAYAAPVQREEDMPVRPATELEVGVTLAKITGLLGKVEEARRRLDEMAAAHQDNPEIEEAQAYMAWRSSDREGALRNFELAFDHGGGEWKTYWDYARLLEATRPDAKEEIDVLRKVVEAKPEFTDARVMLGRELMVTGRGAEALAEMEQIKDTDSRYAGTMFLLMARAAARSGKSAEARQYAAEAKKRALSPEEMKSLDALLSRLDQSASDDDDDGKRPTLRHRGQGKTNP
jgi:Flp pilus assembly protein TadD